MDLTKPHFCLALLIAVGLVACDKGKQPSSQGTQDTGGGSTQYSTRDQVRSELDRALKLATDPDQQKNVFAQFWIDWGRKNKHTLIKVPRRLFPSLNDPGAGTNLSAPEHADKFKSPSLEALVRNRFDRKENGDCLTTSAGEHKDASVSALNTSADICMSIGNLTRIPPASLLGEILGLVLHEAIHLGGGDEAEAQVWQTEFLAYFGWRFGDLTADRASSDTFKVLSSAKVLIARSQEMARANSKNPRVWGTMGRVAQIIATLPDLLDPLALELKTNPKSPKYIRNYQNAAIALVHRIQSRFESRPSVLLVWQLQLPMNLLAPAQVNTILDEMMKHLGQVEENFLAFIGGPEEVQSVCILPTGELDARIFGQNEQSHLSFPPRICAD